MVRGDRTSVASEAGRRPSARLGTHLPAGTEEPEPGSLSWRHRAGRDRGGGAEGARLWGQGGAGSQCPGMHTCPPPPSAGSYELWEQGAALERPLTAPSPGEGCHGGESPRGSPPVRYQEPTPAAWTLTHFPTFIGAQFTTAKIRSPSRCPSADGWVRKLCIHTVLDYAAFNKDGIPYHDKTGAYRNQPDPKRQASRVPRPV